MVIGGVMEMIVVSAMISVMMMMAIMMIRYGIEKFPEKKRQAYLKGTA